MDTPERIETELVLKHKANTERYGELVKKATTLSELVDEYEKYVNEVNGIEKELRSRVLSIRKLLIPYS